MFGKLGDRLKVGKGNDTQHSLFSCLQTNREPDRRCVIENLRGENNREMVCDVRVPSGRGSRTVNEQVLLRVMRFRPVHLDSKLLTLTAEVCKAFNGDCSSPRHSQSRGQFISLERDRFRIKFGLSLGRFVRTAFLVGFQHALVRAGHSCIQSRV